MPTWLRILLVVMAASFLALVLVGVLFFRWIKNRAPEFVEHAKVTREEARKFAEGKHSNDCVEEGLRRVRESKDFFAMIESRLFVDECLNDADEPADFCSSVPTGVLQGAMWANEQCAGKGMRGNQGCTGIYQSVLDHCRRGRESASPPDTSTSR